MTQSKLTPTKTDFCSIYWACRYLAFGEEPIQEEEARILYGYDDQFGKDPEWKVSQCQSDQQPSERLQREVEAYRDFKLALFQGQLKPYVLREGQFVPLDLSPEILKNLHIGLENSFWTSGEDDGTGRFYERDVHVLTAQLLALFPSSYVSKRDTKLLSEEAGAKGRPKKFNYGKYAAVLAAGYVEEGWEKLSQDQLVEKVVELSQHLWPEEKPPSDTSLENEIIREFSKLIPKVTEFLKKKANK
jgi:hypothetical protein